MFDIGFLELCLIGIIALIVLGPERLPKAARTVGKLLHKIKSSYQSVTREIQNELELDELKRKIAEHEERIKKSDIGTDLEGMREKADAELKRIDEAIKKQKTEDAS